MNHPFIGRTISHSRSNLMFLEMTTLLFWNINKKPLIKEIDNLCIYDVDILILAELDISGSTDPLMEI